MVAKRSLLIIDDDPEFCKTASVVLSHEFDCVCAGSGEAALERDLGHVDAVLLDIELGHGIDGFETLRCIRAQHHDLPVIMISRREDIGSVVKATKMGASDYIGKSFNLEELCLKVDRAVSVRSLQRENRLLREEVRARMGRLIGASSAMRAVREEVSRAAKYSSPVLVTGESGTGKELVARDVHDQGDRASRPFVAVNCAAVPEALFESQFFGHEKGSFTGAERRHVGRIEAAGCGTLFLDEIAEMPCPMQAKMLRVLQEMRFERVGSVRSLEMKARIIAATNSDIEENVARGDFRQDLFYRLNVLRIHIPPLRERLDDLWRLVPAIIEKKSREMKRPVSTVSSEAMRSLHAWSWPGNVRELENVLESALVHARGDLLEPEDFPSIARCNTMRLGFSEARSRATEQFERQYLRSVLCSAGGNISEAARLAGLSRFGLQKILKRLDLERFVGGPEGTETERAGTTQAGGEGH